MHVDRSGQVDGAVDHRPAQQLLPACAVTGAEHQLCRVLRGGELDEGRGDVGAGDLVELSPDVLEQLAMLVEQFRIRPGEPILPADVQAEEVSMGALGDARRTADQPFGAWSTGDGDNDASRVSHGVVIPWRSRYSSRPTSTLSATHSKASSRNAARLPARK